MAPHLLTLPWDIRRHILILAFEVGDFYVCYDHPVRAHGLLSPTRGIKQNPSTRLQLQLACSQLRSEVTTLPLANLEVCDMDCAEKYLKLYPEVIPLIRSLKFTSQIDVLGMDLQKEINRWLKHYREHFGADWGVGLSLVVATADQSGDVEIDLSSFSVADFGERCRELYFVCHLKHLAKM